MKIGLAFSGGKDSMACLFLNRYRAEQITVFWVNTGKSYPETIKMVELAKSMFPNFIEVISDRESQNSIEGLPSDIVPINLTRLGFMVTGEKETMIQSYIGCCFENIGLKLQEAALAYGMTHLIRGQRNDESHKSTARDGDLVNGLIYLQPIENWTKDEVFAYLSEFMEIPAHFSIGHSSLDCYDCTAYVKESEDRIEYTKKTHPVFFDEYENRMDKVKKALNQEWCYG